MDFYEDGAKKSISAFKYLFLLVKHAGTDSREHGDTHQAEGHYLLHRVYIYRVGD